MLDTAFESLKKFDWGTDLATVAPIEDAVVAANGKPEIGKDLEKRLISALSRELSRDAQDYLCRKLAIVGTAACVPVLATLVVKKENSHMARFALERIPGTEAAAALREALAKTSGNMKVGIISSLGGRRDSAAASDLGRLLTDGDSVIARAAALALGAIGSTNAVAALQQGLGAYNPITPSIVDALLSCAESLLATNDRAGASKIYQSLAHDSQPRLVRLAATRGMLAAASKQA